MRTQGRTARRSDPRSLEQLRRCRSLHVVRLAVSRSPLCRRSDRVELAAMLAAALLCVVALPFAGVVGGEVRVWSLAEADAQARYRQPVTATLLEDPVTAIVTGGSASTTAEVAWLRPNGLEARAKVPVPLTALRGSEVTVWTTTNGSLTEPPLTPSQVDARAGVAATVALLAALALAWAALHGTRRRLDRLRSQSWEAAWRAFDPGHGC